MDIRTDGQTDNNNNNYNSDDDDDNDNNTSDEDHHSFCNPLVLLPSATVKREREYMFSKSGMNHRFYIASERSHLQN